MKEQISSPPPKLKLYPLKFKPVFIEKPWGGHRIREDFAYREVPETPCGEAWLLSAVPGHETVVENGPLTGNTLSEVYEIFMEELVGEETYHRYTSQFPLLIKILDAHDWLSIQVHPDDELAMERHGTTGKTEMWYILEAEKDARLISGFDREMDPSTLVFLAENDLLHEVMHYEKVAPGEVYYMPAGRVHALGPGVMLAEIQQTSDITYRLYDWNRVDAQGRPREKHLSQALDALDYSIVTQAKTIYSKDEGVPNPILSCEHFSTHLLIVNQAYHKDYSLVDSFIIYLIVAGECILKSADYQITCTKGEVVLLPASTRMVEIVPSVPTTLIEVSI